MMQDALETFGRMSCQASPSSRVDDNTVWDEAGAIFGTAESEMRGAMEDDVEVGFLDITYDAVSQKRTHVFLNSRYAEMLGASRSGLLARFAAHAVDLPSTGPDFLAALLHGMLHRLDAESTQYLRVAAGEGAAGPGMLVCEHSRKRFDGRGRITKVRRLPRACFAWVDSRNLHSAWSPTLRHSHPAAARAQVTTVVREVAPTEYDAALRRAPGACPLLCVAGDGRSGAELVAGLDVDWAYSGRADAAFGRAWALQLDQLAVDLGPCFTRFARLAGQF